MQPLTEVTRHQKTRDAGGDCVAAAWQQLGLYLQTTEAELISLACVNWHSSTWANSGFGLFCHLLDQANLFCVTRVLVEGLQLSLPGGKELLGPSGERLPVPKPISAMPSLPCVYFLSDTLQCYRGAEQELMISAGIIQHTQQLDFQPCYRGVVFNLQVSELMW